MWKSIVFFLLLGIAVSQKLSAEENDYRLLTCGRAPKAPKLTGQFVKGSQAPWTVQVYKNMRIFGGTAISKRHVATLSFHVFDAKVGKALDPKICKKDGVTELAQDIVSELKVTACALQEVCRNGIVTLVKRAWFLGDCVDQHHGTLLLELAADLKEETQATPACMPDPKTEVAVGESLLSFYSTIREPLARVKGVETKVVACPTWKPKNSICFDGKACGAQGDGYIKMIDGQFTLVSVANAVVCTDKDNYGNIFAEFEPKICELTGICHSNKPLKPFTPPQIKRSGRMLSKAQNEQLLKSCGVVKADVLSSVPWMVKVRAQAPSTPGDLNAIFTPIREVNGVAISQKHVFVSPDIFFNGLNRFDNSQLFKFEDCSDRQSDITNQTASFFTITPCLKSECNLPPVKVQRVLFIGNCNMKDRNMNYGLILLELATDLPASTVPLCVPESNIATDGSKLTYLAHNVAPSFELKVTAYHAPAAYNIGGLSLYVQEEPKCSGTEKVPLVRNVKGQWTIAGLTVGYGCKKDHPIMNVAQLSEKICRFSGVCGSKMLKPVTIQPIVKPKKVVKPVTSSTVVTNAPATTKKVMVTSRPVTPSKVTAAPKTAATTTVPQTTVAKTTVAPTTTTPTTTTVPSTAARIPEEVKVNVQSQYSQNENQNQNQNTQGNSGQKNEQPKEEPKKEEKIIYPEETKDQSNNPIQTDPKPQPVQSGNQDRNEQKAENQDEVASGASIANFIGFLTVFLVLFGF